MKIRTEQPKNNKYYIRTVSGGLNNAVQGSPVIKGANVLCNCVGYANGRFNEIINDPDLKGTYKTFKYQLVCNAENFIEAARKQGHTISATPTVGGIMVWQKGKTLGGGDGAGHVEVVEEIYSDGSCLCSSSGYAGWAFRLLRRNNGNGRWGQNSNYKFRGCVVNPTIGKGVVVPSPKLTVDGNGGVLTVMKMQEFLGTTIDGVISGQKKGYSSHFTSLTSVTWSGAGSTCITKLQKWLGVTATGILNDATIKAWQKKLGLTADGYFGSASMKAWQEYLNANVKAVVEPVKEKKAYTGDYPNITVKTKTERGPEIAAKATEYCYPYGTATSKYAYKTGSVKSSYKTALKKLMNKTAKISQTDCGYFVSICVRASGIASSFLALPASYKDAYPSVPSTMEIVHKGKAIPSGLLKPGDIIRYRKSSSQHALMYYASGKIAEAGREHWFPAIKKDTKKYNGSSAKLSTLQVLRAKPKDGVRDYLTKGDTGAEIKKLQNYLNWFGNYGLTADGSFGAKTLDAVKKMQKALGLTVDGYIGPKTLAAMKAVKK